MDDQAEVMRVCDETGCNESTYQFWITQDRRVVKSIYCVRHGNPHIRRFNTKDEAQLWLVKQRL